MVSFIQVLLLNIDHQELILGGQIAYSDIPTCHSVATYITP